MRYMEENEREKFMSHRQSGDCYQTVKEKRKHGSTSGTKASVAQKILRVGGWFKETRAIV